MKRLFVIVLLLVAVVCTAQDRWHTERLPQWAIDENTDRDVTIYSIQHIAYLAPELYRILLVNRFAWTYRTSNTIIYYSMDHDDGVVYRWFIYR